MIIDHALRKQVVTAGFLLLFALFTSRALKAQSVAPRADYAPVVQKLQAFIEYQMQDKNLPGLSIALVDGQQTVWAKGFGYADRDKKTPATAETVYRIASVSKLFTDIAIMQMVERGELDLDVPITTYLPDFRPKNPFGKPITLRQLMSHHSGLV
ncbi:MAG: class A beta-lactamase-related serine hydrolase, partial [Calditrichaeota bacterium]